MAELRRRGGRPGPAQTVRLDRDRPRDECHGAGRWLRCVQGRALHRRAVGKLSVFCAGRESVPRNELLRQGERYGNLRPRPPIYGPGEYLVGVAVLHAMGFVLLFRKNPPRP